MCLSQTADTRYGVDMDRVSLALKHVLSRRGISLEKRLRGYTCIGSS